MNVLKIVQYSIVKSNYNLQLIKNGIQNVKYWKKCKNIGTSIICILIVTSKYRILFSLIIYTYYEWPRPNNI